MELDELDRRAYAMQVLPAGLRLCDPAPSHKVPDAVHSASHAVYAV